MKLEEYRADIEDIAAGRTEFAQPKEFGPAEALEVIASEIERAAWHWTYREEAQQVAALARQEQQRILARR